jgi:hypothetical protein
VGSADVTAWAKNLPDNEPQELYVEIRLDDTVVQATGMVKRNEILSWNEELLLYV